MHLPSSSFLSVICGLVFVSRPSKTHPVFTKSEKQFLSSQEVCRVATCSDSIPHVTPVSYLFDPSDGSLYFATDYDTKKFRNLKLNRNICVSVDTYASSEGNAAVIVHGVSEFIEQGAEFKRLYDLFFERFSWVRRDPWKPGEAPFVRIVPQKKISWGLD